MHVALTKAWKFLVFFHVLSCLLHCNLPWIALPGRLSNLQNEPSFRADGALAAEVPRAENVGLQVEGVLGGYLSNRVCGHGNISSFLPSLILANLLLVNKAAQDSFQPFVTSR